MIAEDQQTARREARVTIRMNDAERAALLLISLKQHCTASHAIRALILSKAEQYVIARINVGGGTIS
jgi:hypothetical protein